MAEIEGANDYWLDEHCLNNQSNASKSDIICSDQTFYLLINCMPNCNIYCLIFITLSGRS
jgi:hypothetical protein